MITYYIWQTLPIDYIFFIKYISWFKLFLCVLLTPFTILLDLILLPFEIISFIIYKIMENRND